MAKRSRPKHPASARTATAEPRGATATADAAVGPRQPCPCGSGRRYKACHGDPRGASTFVNRTFEGLPHECDWVALREFVQAGKAAIELRPSPYADIDSDSPVQVVTVLPGLVRSMRREDGEAWLGLQIVSRSGDESADLADALAAALVTEPGTPVDVATAGTTGKRLQDVIAPESAFEVQLFEGFEFWFEAMDDPDGALAASLEQLNASVDPTARLTSVDAAYWVSVGSKEHLRWVMPHDEERLLTALARLHAAGADQLGEDSRMVGSFRAHGLLVPVWDLPVGTGAEAVEKPAAEFAERLGEALTSDAALTDAERSARHGLATRQLTIR